MNRQSGNIFLVAIVAVLASFAFQTPAQCDLIGGLGGAENVAPQASSNVAAGATDQTISDRTGYTDAPYTVFVADGGNVTLTWATPRDLMGLGAYLSSNDPAGVNPYLDRETGSIDFELDMGSGLVSVGTVQDDSFILAPEDPTNIWSYASLGGDWSNVTQARYTFHLVGNVGPRIGDVIATQVPEPASLTLVLLGALLAMLTFRRRRG